MRTLYNVTYKGKKYKAINNNKKLCFGCAFYTSEDPDIYKGCAIYTKNHACVPSTRGDGSHIIWVEVKSSRRENNHN